MSFAITAHCSQGKTVDGVILSAESVVIHDAASRKVCCGSI